MNRRMARLGSFSLCVSAAGFAWAEWLLFSRLDAGLPAPLSGGVVALVAMVLSIFGVCAVSFERGAAFWLGALFAVSGCAVVVGSVVLKTGWGGDVNIGAGAVYLLGMALMPVVAVVAAVAAGVTASAPARFDRRALHRSLLSR